MRLSVGVLYDSREDRCFDYGEKEVNRLIDHLKKCDLLIGFNIQRFDYQVLKGVFRLSLRVPAHPGFAG